MIKLEVGKRYINRESSIVTIVSKDNESGIYRCNLFFNSHKEDGKCEKCNESCSLDIISEVVENKEQTGYVLSSERGATYGSPIQLIKEQLEEPKQSLLSLSLSLPQGTETITLTQKVLVDGIEYLAKIDLEKV